jgi:hypothetical protein
MEGIQTVREKFSCRQCEKITQPPAAFRVTARGFAGPRISGNTSRSIARASVVPARVLISASTLADQVSACAMLLQAAQFPDRGPCAGGRTAARRRHHGSDPGEGQDGQGAHLDLCARRPAIWRTLPRGTRGMNIRPGIFEISRAFCRPTRVQ